MLVGLVLMGVMPTTVSSNVVMTGQAGGDASAATVEIMIGNLAGTFITPALLQMFLSAPGWQFGKPVPAGGGGTGEIYVAVIKQLAFSVFIPLVRPSLPPTPQKPTNVSTHSPTPDHRTDHPKPLARPNQNLASSLAPRKDRIPLLDRRHLVDFFKRVL